MKGKMQPNLEVNLGALKLKNPVVAASGTFGNGTEFAPFVELEKLGGFVLKTVTLRPRTGNPPPRIVETVAGIVNSIGLQNDGVEHLVNVTLPEIRAIRICKIVSVGGATIDDYVQLARILDGKDGVDAIELNISCPNVKRGGVAFGMIPETTQKVLKAVRRVTALPLIAKLPPAAVDITKVAIAAEKGGADAVSLINTIPALVIDWRKRSSALGGFTGGLSGPCIKPIALRMVWQVARGCNLPVVGMGGIVSGADALEFIVAGATAVQVGTANFLNPRACVQIIDEITEALKKEKIYHVRELVGSLKKL